MAKEEELVKVTIRLPKRMVRRAKHEAVDAGTNLQTMLTEALRRYLAEKGGK